LYQIIYRIFNIITRTCTTRGLTRVDPGMPLTLWEQEQRQRHQERTDERRLQDVINRSRRDDYDHRCHGFFNNYFTLWGDRLGEPTSDTTTPKPPECDGPPAPVAGAPGRGAERRAPVGGRGGERRAMVGRRRGIGSRSRLQDNEEPPRGLKLGLGADVKY
jgi:hypothetical protein